MNDRVRAVLDAGAREWSDELEAISGLLGAAGILDLAIAQRRSLARQLVRRKASSDDVLSWLVQHLRRGRGAGWLLNGLRKDPEAIWKERASREQLVCGTINDARQAQLHALIGDLAHARKPDRACMGNTVPEGMGVTTNTVQPAQTSQADLGRAISVGGHQPHAPHHTGQPRAAQDPTGHGDRANFHGLPAMACPPHTHHHTTHQPNNL